MLITSDYRNVYVVLFGRRIYRRLFVSINKAIGERQ
jgi:hypothetical protein